MDNLREFVKKNRAAFDTEPLDEGHRGRFAAKLARGTERGASVLLRRFWAAGCAAAVVLGLLWLRKMCIRDRYNVPTAIDRSSADFLISSPLFGSDYTPVVKDYKSYVERTLNG